MSGVKQPWLEAPSAKALRTLISSQTVEGGQGKWNSLDIGGGVKIKIKGKDFSPTDVKDTQDVFKEARTDINIANQIVNDALSSWSEKTKALAERYFFVASNALEEAHAQKIRSVISAAQTGLNQPMSLKLVDGAGTRASVPQSSQEFINNNSISVKPNWIKHPGSDDKSTMYAAGIRFDRWYLQGSGIEDKTVPTIVLRAKTLIHESTHRFANTKDYAYFKDDGVALDTNLVAPALSETDKWLDNADSFGWFCVQLAKA